MTIDEAILYMNAYKMRLVNSIGNGLDKDIEAFDIAINALEQNRWIPVSENPKEYGKYLTYHADGMMYVGSFSEYGWGFGHYVKDVLAYMLLPEPYRGGEGE